MILYLVTVTIFSHCTLHVHVVYRVKWVAGGQCGMILYLVTYYL